MGNKQSGNKYNNFIDFTLKLEKLCYKEGNGNIPVQKNIDFRNNLPIENAIQKYGKITEFILLLSEKKD